MALEKISIKSLDGAAVLCETRGCDKPAHYLFSEAGPPAWCAAHCEFHARAFADRRRLRLPPAKEIERPRWLHASA
jgi:hypothetical protein